MWTKLLTRIGLALLTTLPVERICAWALNRLLARIDAGKFDRAEQTAQHLLELSTLFADILKDKQISPTEASEARARVMSLRLWLLDAWAEGRSGKGLQAQIPALLVYSETNNTGGPNESQK